MTSKTESQTSPRIAELERELEDARRRMSASNRDAVRLMKKIEAEMSGADRWTKLATTAMRAGDDVVAKDALDKRRAAERATAALRGELAVKTEQLRSLGTVVSSVGFQLDQARATLVVAARTSDRPPPMADPSTEALRPLAKASPASLKKPLAKAARAPDKAAAPAARRTKR